MTPWRKWSDPPPDRGPVDGDEEWARIVERYGGDAVDSSDATVLELPAVNIFKGGNMLYITTTDGTLHEVEFDPSCVLSVKRRIQVGPESWDTVDFAVTDVADVYTGDVAEPAAEEDAGMTGEELLAHLNGLERDALVAEAFVRGIENPHQTKSAVLVEGIFAAVTAEPEAA